LLTSFLRSMRKRAVIHRVLTEFYRDFLEVADQIQNITDMFMMTWATCLINKKNIPVIKRVPRPRVFCSNFLTACLVRKLTMETKQA